MALIPKAITNIFNPITDTITGVFNGQYTPTAADYEKLTRESIVKNPYARSCVDLVTKSAASVPVKVQERKGSEWVDLKDDDPIALLMAKPYKRTPATKWRRLLYRDYVTNGKAYIYRLPKASLAIKGSVPAMLMRIRPDRVLPRGGDGYNLFSGFDYVGNDGRFPRLDVEDVLYIRDDHPLEDFDGLSRTESAMIAIDMNNAALKANAAMWQNGARPAGIWRTRGTVTQKLKADIRRMLRQDLGGPAKHGTDPILGGDLKYERTGLSPVEMEAIEEVYMTAGMIAGVYGVPIVFVDPRQATYSNMQEAHLMLFQDTAIPLSMR
jgi:HK97 family phage portal protein